MIYPIQVRAGRALIGMSQQELAERSGVGIATLKRLEASGTELIGKVQTFLRIQKALEAEGVIFIDQDGRNGPGVRLRDPLA